jgi:hypothetical protein
MKKLQLAIAASLVMGSAVLPMSAQAAQHKPMHKVAHTIKHRKLLTAGAGIAGYEMAKHSHSKFARKHRFAAGIAAAIIANKAMKAHDKKIAHGQ